MRIGSGKIERSEEYEDSNDDSFLSFFFDEDFLGFTEEYEKRFSSSEFDPRYIELLWFLDLEPFPPFELEEEEDFFDGSGL